TNIGADGDVEADAIRIEKLIAPEIFITSPNIDPTTNTPINFGAVAKNSTASRTFTVWNAGPTGSTLNLNNLAVTGGFTNTAFSSSSLAAGQSATFTIGMPTSAANSFTGSATFTTNDTNDGPYEDTYKFPLTGSVNATSVFYGNDQDPTTANETFKTV